MKKLLSILCLGLFCSLAHATGITVVTSCTAAAATSCTLGATPSFGNLMVSMAYNGSSATAPGTPTGYTVIKSQTGNTNAIKISYKYSAGNETTCGTASSATASFCEVYSGAWIFGNGSGAAGGLGGAFGANTSGATQTTASTTLSYGTFTLSNPLSTSWVLCVGGASAATAGADVAPTGMTLRSGTAVPTIAYADTNGNVNTWSTQTVTYTTAGHNATACAEIVGTPAVSSIASNVVTRVYGGSSEEACTGACQTTFYIPSASLSNNHIDVWFAWTYASVAPTVSTIYANGDTGHATWTFTLDKSSLDTGNTTDLFHYYIDGAAAGITSITITASSVWTAAEFAYDEINGVATSSAIDKSAALSANGAYLTAGALSPTQTGDVWIQHCTTAGLGQQTATQITTSGGTQNLLADKEFVVSTIGFVETGSESLTPANFTTGASGGADCISEALKASPGSGTAASGVHIDDFEDLFPGTQANINPQFTNLKTGDASMDLVYGVITANATQWSALTSLINTYTSHQPHDANGGYPNEALDCDETTAGDDVMSFTNPSSGVNVNMRFEISGLNNSSHTACYDSTAGTPINGTVASGTSPSFSSLITPSVSGGIVITASETGTGPGSAVTAPSGAEWLVGVYTGQSDASKMGAGNLLGALFSPTTSAETWTFTNCCSTGYNATAIHLETASSSQPTPPLWVIVQ